MKNETIRHEKRRTIKVILALGAGISSPWVPGLVHAAGPLKIVVPFPPGSATDSLGRLLARTLETELGQPVIVENKPGAGGVIGATAVKNAEPDGSTLLLTTNTTQAANASLFKELPYDPVKDFEAIGQVGGSGMMLMIRPDQKFDSVQDLAKALRDKATTYGHGSAASHVAAALFVRQSGINATPVPYKGVPAAVVDLIGGRLDFVFVDISSASGLMASGKLKGLAVALPARTPREPRIPTLTELGISGVEVPGWFGLMAPANTPSADVQRLSKALEKALTDEKLRESMLGIGIAPTYKAPPEFAAMIKTEVARWKAWVTAAGIEPA